MLLTLPVAGCLSNETVEISADLAQSEVVVVHTYQNGALVSTEAATVNVDFSGSVAASKYTVEVSDGRDVIQHAPEDGSVISLDIGAHGVHTLTVTAVDSNGRSATRVLTVHVNLQIIWTEEGTQDPSTLAFDPLPEHGGPTADYITIESVVSNPDLIQNLGGGREVDVTWRLIDPLGGACQQHSDVVHEGESAAWNTLHFNTYEAHDLAVDYDEGQDEIDVHHTVIVAYEPVA
jgi:hypothetical protein